MAFNAGLTSTLTYKKYEWPLKGLGDIPKNGYQILLRKGTFHLDYLKAQPEGKEVYHLMVEGRDDCYVYDTADAEWRLLLPEKKFVYFDSSCGLKKVKL